MELGSGNFGLKVNGEAWGWGRNYYGALGDTIAVDVSVSSPILVTGIHSFVQIDCGTYHVLGLKADGSAWGWGGGYALGIGVDPYAGSYSSPVAVVGGHVFTQIVTGATFTLALKANGEVWSWGANSSGELGRAGGAASVPALVQGAHSFVRIHAGDSSAFGLKANGELWAWGCGTGGATGTNTAAYSQDSPLLVVGGHRNS